MKFLCYVFISTNFLRNKKCDAVIYKLKINLIKGHLQLFSDSLWTVSLENVNRL